MTQDNLHSLLSPHMTEDHSFNTVFGHIHTPKSQTSYGGKIYRKALYVMVKTMDVPVTIFPYRPIPSDTMENMGT